MIRTVRAAGFAVAACVACRLRGLERSVAGRRGRCGAGRRLIISTMPARPSRSATSASTTRPRRSTPARRQPTAGRISARSPITWSRSPTPCCRARVGLGELVQSYAGLATDDREQDCLANAVYFEARGEPIEGQLAVAEVVLNRAALRPLSLDPLRRRHPARQFSFVRHGIIPRADRGSEAWRRAVAVARIAESGASACCRATCSGTMPIMSARAGAAASPATPRSGSTSSTARGRAVAAAGHQVEADLNRHSVRKVIE